IYIYTQFVRRAILLGGDELAHFRQLRSAIHHVIDANHARNHTRSDESKLYIIEVGVVSRVIRVYDVVDGGTQLSGMRKFIIVEQNGMPDGLRVDVDGNLWVGWGMGVEGLDSITIFNPANK